MDGSLYISTTSRATTRQSPIDLSKVSKKRLHHPHLFNMALSSDVAEIDGGQITYEPSLFHYIEPSITSNPNHPAVIVAHQDRNHLVEITGRSSGPQSNRNSASCLTWTYIEMQHAALKLVASLQKQGIAPGSTVVTFIPNGIEWALSSGRPCSGNSLSARLTLEP